MFSYLSKKNVAKARSGKLTKELGVTHLLIRGNSQLVINKVHGDSEARDATMVKYLGKVQILFVI